MPKRLLALLILFASVSPASAQLVADAERINALKPGVATPEDVRASFGEPEHIDI